jgi:hypothetical protein
MAKTRSLQVVISGDAKDLNRAFKSVDQSAKHTESKLGSFGKNAAKGFALVGAAAAGAAVVGLKKATDAAIEAEKSQARMEAQLKASGASYKAHAKEIDAVIQKHSKLAGIDDEDLQDAFTNIVRSSGSVQTGLKNVGLAADISAARHISAAKAGELVGKVAAGNTNALARYGVKVKEGATVQEALAAAQRKFGGQSEAYGKTTAGAMARAGVAVENLGEIVGAKLAPFIAKGANALANFVDKSGGLAGPIRTASGAIRSAYNNIVEAVSRFQRRHAKEIDDVIRAARALGRAFRAVFENVVVPVVRTAVEILGRVLGRIARVLGGIIGTVAALINGDWRTAWRRFRGVVADTVKGVAGTIKDVGGAVWSAVTALGKLVVRGIVKGIKATPGAIADAIKGLFKGVAGIVGNAVGDVAGAASTAAQQSPGIGPGSTPGPLLPGGATPGGLSSAARSGLSKIQQLFGGVRVTSGRRSPAENARVGGAPNSDHLSGNALDLVPTEGWTPSGVARLDRIVAWAKRSGLVRWIGWRGVPGHGPGDHLHLSFKSGGRDTGDVTASTPGRIAGVSGNAKSGIGLAVDAAVKAGFSGTDLVNMVAIAGRESGYNPAAHNPVPPDDSWGLWQINVRPEANPRFKSWKLTDPYVNARAARILFKSAGLSPWKHAGGPLGDTNVAAARAAVRAYRAGGGKGPAAAPSGGGGGAAPEKVNPYDLAIAGSDVAVAEATGGGRGLGGGRVSPALAEAQAQSNRLAIVNREIRRVRTGLKKAKTPATKLRLRQQLAQLLGERNTITGRIEELRKSPELDAGEALPTPGDFLSARTSQAGLTAGLEDDLAVAREAVDLRRGEYGTALGTGDPRKISEAADALKAASENLESVSTTIAEAAKQERIDWSNAELALAQLTDATEDDVAALQSRQSLEEQALAEAQAANDPRRISEAASNLKGTRDALKEFQKAAEEDKRAREEHTAALKAVADELKRQTDFAERVQTTESFQLKKYLADVISGQIGGTGVVPRSYTPGSGVAYQY